MSEIKETIRENIEDALGTVYREVNDYGDIIYEELDTKEVSEDIANSILHELPKPVNGRPKHIMPRMFDDWAKKVLKEYDKFYAISLITRAGWGYWLNYKLQDESNIPETSSLINWINAGNKEKAVEALLYGYEVRKEPVFVVTQDGGYISSLILSKHTYEKKCTQEPDDAVKFSKQDAEAVASMVNGEVEGYGD